MNTKKIVFFDVDHTLYDPFEKRVPPSNVEALKKLHERDDVLLAIATGRAFYMLDIVKEIQPYIDLYITINGQLIYHGDRLIEDLPMPKEDVATVKELFNRHGLAYGFIGKESHAISRLNSKIVGRFYEQSLPLPDLNPDFEKENRVYQMWAFSTPKQMHAVETELEGYRLVPWIEEGFDVIHKLRSKKEGVLKTLTLLNIPLENAYCFGDGNNDKEMLAAIPNSVAMGNASEHVKSHAAHVTAPFYEDGIEKALLKFGLLK